MNKPRVALIHDYLYSYGGAERLLSTVAQIYPEADIFTGIYKPEKMPADITSKNVYTKQNFLTKKFTKYFTFAMPIQFESFDLRKYDIILSDSASWAKGVITRPEQLHISYIHTPPRFLYRYSYESAKRDKWYFKPVITYLDAFLRVWDYQAAQRADHVLVSSREIAKRVKKIYRRDSTVIYPPVETNLPRENYEHDNLSKPFYLALGRIVAYKNFDLLVNAFNLLDFNLVIVGEGPELDKLKKLARGNIKLTGSISEQEKGRYLYNCLGVINPVVDEDFGIVPVEAGLFQKPVLAHKSGGHLETIIEDKTGMFLESLETDYLVSKIKEFDTAVKNNYFDKNLMLSEANKYSVDRFKKEYQEYVERKWKEKVDLNAGTS